MVPATMGSSLQHRPVLVIQNYLKGANDGVNVGDSLDGRLLSCVHD